VVLGRWQGLVAGAALLVSTIVFWLVIPRRLRERTPPPRAQDL
jgi:hypothetical protein